MMSSNSGSESHAMSSSTPDKEKPRFSTVKTKSKGFRNTGLLGETSKTETDSKKLDERKSIAKPALSDVAIKRNASSHEDSFINKKQKSIKSKRSSISEDGGFMAALQSVSPDTSKKKTFKKRLTERDLKQGRTISEKKDLTIKAIPEKSTKVDAVNDTIKGDGAVSNTILNDVDTPMKPALSAPPFEEYETIKVVFSNTESKRPTKSSLKKLVPKGEQSSQKLRWKSDLKEVFEFELDDTERVNVHTMKFTEMMAMDKANERQFNEKCKNEGKPFGDYDEKYISKVESFMPWKLYSVHIFSPPKQPPGEQSQEKHTQASRESFTMTGFFLSTKPDSPGEADAETVPYTDPQVIPFDDISGNFDVRDYRQIIWPEPLINPTTVNITEQHQYQQQQYQPQHHQYPHHPQHPPPHHHPQHPPPHHLQHPPPHHQQHPPPHHQQHPPPHYQQHPPPHHQQHPPHHQQQPQQQNQHQHFSTWKMPVGSL